MSNNLLERASQVIMPTYARFPLVFEKGRGCILTDTEGNQYLDFVAGIAVCALGHNDPGLTKTIADQAGKLMHVSNLYWTEPQITAAEILVKASYLDKVFFCNSGAEANEGALKLARLYGKAHKGEEATQIVCMDHSFHGRTYGAITATGQPKYHKGFNPLLPDIIHVPFNDYEALAAVVSEKTCAVLLEPIQGEGGIYPADEDYLKKVRALCDDNKLLLIFDEVQSGIGRTGKFFAYQHYGIIPDIVTIAKGMAGGFPMGAMIATDDAAALFTPGTHASTFGGNPLAAAAATYVLGTVADDKFLTQVADNGAYLRSLLEAAKEEYAIIEDIRGEGLMLGIELSVPGAEIIRRCMDNGLLLIGAGEKVIRFVPPLVVSKDEIKRAVDILLSCF